VARVNTVIVGGGPAGIATGASLHRRGIDAVILEQGETVAPAWKRHYDRLHLHTYKAGSDLPGRPMPADFPKYPSRDQVWSYLDDYATAEQLDIRLDARVTGVATSNGGWVISAADGSEFQASNVVVATGLNRVPRIPTYPNQESYTGEILHTADYKNGAPYAGKPVLVVGFGNSAAEIALDLMEHGAISHISVRSPSVVVPGTSPGSRSLLWPAGCRSFPRGLPTGSQSRCWR
jgi:cation diffusion facilitator CzcD-associated flavoprotein CzcO